MISTSKTGLALVMGIAFVVSPGATAQDAPQIFISDGTDVCTAALVSLQVDTDTGNVSASVDSLEECAGPGTPSITSFTVNGNPSATTVDEGEAVTVGWDSVNTNGCSAGGTLQSWANQGSLTSSGSIPVSTSGLADGNYSLTLNCASGQGSIAASNNPLTILVQNSSVSGACDTRLPPAGMQRATQINADFPSANAFFFAEVFGGPFPGNFNSIRIRIPATDYAAMQFTTGDHPADALGEMQVVPVNLPNTGTNSKLWSISQCPGDFRPFVLDDEMGPGCVSGPTQGAFRFGGTNYRNDSGRCALEPNTTYYLNVFYTDDAPPATEQAHSQLNVDCSEFFCGDSMKAAVLGF